MSRLVSCGVIVTNGHLVLLGHTTRSPRWDIPKGIAEPGEEWAATAARELQEETGLRVPTEDLRELGVHGYLPGKDLALFVCEPSSMPASECLRCHSTFELRTGVMVPEFDSFGLFAWDAVFEKVGKNLARVLAAVRPRLSR